MNFPQIDTSYWLTEDPEWVAARKEHWLKVEPMLLGQGQKSKKAITIIKRYFLQGTMPDFEKLKVWNNHERHLDIFCFIWLHPSWDKKLLLTLMNAYINYPFVKEEDVSQGLALFLGAGIISATESYNDDEILHVLYTDGNNELLFDIFFVEAIVDGLFREKFLQLIRSQGDMSKIFIMGQWLCNTDVNFLNEDCLYIYDQPLECWYRNLSTQIHKDFFDTRVGANYIYPCKEALYRIHHFDTEKEGDTCRTHFVTKMRKMLNERDFIPVFKQMWLDVKAGKIDVEDPWER